MNPTVLLVYEDEEKVAEVEAAARATDGLKNLVLLQGADALADYLDRCHPSLSGDQLPCPNLILLDLKQSIASVRDVLVRLKQDEVFKPIPIVVLARAPVEEEYLESYDLGVNAFVRRPEDAAALAETLAVIENFWLGVVTLPHAEKAARV